MSSAKTTAVKVTFGHETRRVGSEFFLEGEWATFCQRVRKLFEHENELEGLADGSAFAVTYTDSDGDVVTVSSTAELQEAFKAQGEVARFTFTERSRRHHRFSGGCRRGWRSVEAGGVCGASWWPTRGTRCGGEAPRPAHQFRCRWGQQREALQEALQLNAEVVQLLEQNKLSEAAILLQTGLQRHANNHTLWYNLACTEALRGERPGALAALRAAVQNGYTDAEHALGDEDLICLQSSPEFAEIVACMRNGDTTRYVDNHEAYLNSSLVHFRKEGAIEDAWKVVEQGVELGVKAPQFLYNAACIASLLRRDEEAVAFLVEAVVGGYDDVQSIKVDEALDNIRAHSGYFAAVNILAQKKGGFWQSLAEAEADATEAAGLGGRSPSDSDSAASASAWVELDEATNTAAAVEERTTTTPPTPQQNDQHNHANALPISEVPAPPVDVAVTTPPPPPVESVVVPVVRAAPTAPLVVPVAPEPLPTPRTATLMGMGFERGSAKAALEASNGDVQRAVNVLLQ